jgi:hypothetical protein
MAALMGADLRERERERALKSCFKGGTDALMGAG